MAITGNCPKINLTVICPVNVRMRKKDGVAWPAAWEEITENVPGETDSGLYQFMPEPGYYFTSVRVNGGELEKVGNIFTKSLIQTETTIEFTVAERKDPGDFKSGTPKYGHDVTARKLDEVLEKLNVLLNR